MKLVEKFSAFVCLYQVYTGQLLLLTRLANEKEIEPATYG